MFQRATNILKSNSFFLFGARGTGKTTYLEEQFIDQEAIYLNLLENEIYSKLQANPDYLIQIISQQNKPWCIIDEIQRVPELLNTIHLLIEKHKQKFGLTGSSARKLKRSGTNLLAGRAYVYKMFPLTHRELGVKFNLIEQLQYGSLPKIFSIDSHREKLLYLRSYTETYLREEIAIEQIIRKLPPFRRFLGISAHQDTELVSYSNIGRDVLVDPKIISNYYSVLEDTLLGFFLEPFHTSIRKRQGKTSKFYWFDLGVRRSLSCTVDSAVTPSSFEFGSLFESYVVNEIFRLLTYSEKDFKLSFLRVDDNQEIDLVLERPGEKLCLIEIKSTSNIHEGHVKNLKVFGKSFQDAKKVVLSLDNTSRLIEGISCHHWQMGLRELNI